MNMLQLNNKIRAVVTQANGVKRKSNQSNLVHLERSFSRLAPSNAHNLSRVFLRHVSYHQSVVTGFVDQYLVRSVVLDLTAVDVPRDFGVRLAADADIKTGHFAFGHVTIVTNAHEVWGQHFALDHLNGLQLVVSFSDDVLSENRPLRRIVHFHRSKFQIAFRYSFISYRCKK